MNFKFTSTKKGELHVRLDNSPFLLKYICSDNILVIILFLHSKTNITK